MPRIRLKVPSSLNDKEPPSTVWEAAKVAYDCVSNLEQPKHRPIVRLLNEVPYRQPLENQRPPGHKKPFSVLKRRRNQNLLALCVQLCGSPRTNTQRCTRYINGRGMWQECVVAPQLPGRQTDILNSACASCYYNGCSKNCSFVTRVTAPEPSLPLAAQTVQTTALMPTLAVSHDPKLTNYIEE
ncbi:uncharacterized protein F4822DRAFT_384797 [Hypoxylon trugodes]|uniref:uncharacterized protein n=1 Tax=Hypoxylon trugodes TaxID=326681 RepID=UPI0021A0E0AA|nr:uncharacterized protein F4822DRAFT_384797 [Hypoxylon trugodes]KAI1393476.1 hypothetical protein F4822DRAFT_384797 [Hypoxylon trugodes]